MCDDVGCPGCRDGASEALTPRPPLPKGERGSKRGQGLGRATSDCRPLAPPLPFWERGPGGEGHPLPATAALQKTNTRATPMTDEAAFLEAIRAAPNDLAPRLVYADWLDDHSD